MADQLSRDTWLEQRLKDRQANLLLLKRHVIYRGAIEYARKEGADSQRSVLAALKMYEEVERLVKA